LFDGVYLFGVSKDFYSCFKFNSIFFFIELGGVNPGYIFVLFVRGEVR